MFEARHSKRLSLRNAQLSFATWNDSLFNMIATYSFAMSTCPRSQYAQSIDAPPPRMHAIRALSWPFRRACAINTRSCGARGSLIRKAKENGMMRMRLIKPLLLPPYTRFWNVTCRSIRRRTMIPGGAADSWSVLRRTSTRMTQAEPVARREITLVSTDASVRNSSLYTT